MSKRYTLSATTKMASYDGMSKNPKTTVLHGGLSIVQLISLVINYAAKWVSKATNA